VRRHASGALFAQNSAVKTIVAEGDPVEAILGLTTRDPPDIAIVGVPAGAIDALSSRSSTNSSSGRRISW